MSVEEILSLSNLQVDKQKYSTFKKNFESIIKFIDKLKTFKQEGSVDFNHTGLNNITSKDLVIKKSLSQKGAIMNANNIKGYIATKQVLHI